ncbi:MAG: hypothetical protein HYZ18_00770 [Pseudogulbenkiania sp.]|nr:hypothetical protein [Pseudogulbenkiania sp.]
MSTDRKHLRVNIPAVAAAAMASLDSLLRDWLPDGKKEGCEWSATNPTRHDKKAGSFKVNLNSGAWSDFALGDSGGDPVSLYRYIFSLPSQVEAAKELGELLRLPVDVMYSEVSLPDAKPVAKKSPWVPVLPVPTSAPEMHKAHSVRGWPQRVAVYHDQAGQLLGAVMRFVTSDGGKDDIPHTYCTNTETGEQEWRWMGFPEPRPLYGLDALSAKPDAVVLIPEGEKCKDVAATLLDEYAVLSWPGGSKAVKKADWTPLAGRSVLIWPDADSQREKLTKAEKEAGVDPESKPYLAGKDQPGMKASAQIAEILLGLGCTVSVIGLPEPGKWADGWDVADAVQKDGWAADQVREFIAEHAQPFGQPAPSAEPDSAVEMPAAGWADDVPPDTGSAEAALVDSSAPAQAGDSGGEADVPWRMLLKRNEEGVQKAVLANAYLVLTHHPAWQGVLGFDEFSQNVVKLKAPPYAGGKPGLWQNGDASKTLVWLQLNESLMLRSSAAADEAALMVARDHPFHAVRDWLESLPAWDGTERLSSLLEDAFGADRNDYTKHVGTGWLVAAVARVYDPGCKVDEMLVLEGGQGLGKSTTIRDLFGADWYTEISERPDDKDFLIAIQGNWSVEIGEMQSFSKAEINQVKMIVTRRNDKFRPPYERHATDHPRQCVFVGTTNSDQYLADPTGGRRFLPVTCREANVDAVRSNRDQLWAEALHQYRAGFKWWDFPKDLAREEQDNRYLSDSWEEIVVRYLDGGADPNYYPQDKLNGPVEVVTTTELLSNALRLDTARHGRPEQTRVGQIMTRLAWKKVRLPPDRNGYRAWVFKRPEVRAAA